MAPPWCGMVKSQSKKMETLQSPKIFLVDDDPFFAAMYEQYLINQGYTDVTVLNNGQDCVNRLIENPEIMFIDYSMELINGLDLLKKIKRFNPDIYIVFVSAQEDIEVAVNALKYGAFDYIIKGEKDRERISSVLRKIKNVSDMLGQKKPRNGWNKLISLF